MCWQDEIGKKDEVVSTCSWENELEFVIFSANLKIAISSQVGNISIVIFDDTLVREVDIVYRNRSPI